MKNGDLKQIGQLLDNKLAPIQKKLNKHEKMLKSIKDQDTMLKFLDGEQMRQSRRIKRVEDHLGLPTLAS